jgi:hypothetical protein
MSERRPASSDPRASVVDSGWSEPAITERQLPRYDEGGREQLVTRVDDQIQARIAAMNYDERTEVTVAPLTSPLPPPPPLPPAPPVPPPPPLPVHQTARPLPPVPELKPAPVDEHTVVDSQPPVSTLPPLQPTVRAPSLPPPSLPPLPLPRASFSPSFSPMQAGSFEFEGPPPLGRALAERVRFGGAVLPLWGILLPVFGVTALVAALLAGYLAPSGNLEHAATAKAPSSDAAAVAAASSSPPSPTGTRDTSSNSGSVLERARSGDERAIGVLEHQPPEDRGTEEALALAAGKVAQELSSVTKLRARLASDPGLAKDPKVIADLRRMAQEPDTSRDALAAMSALPGPISADLLYDAWTSTPEHSTATELAQALLMGRDVRPKASPALAIALDLRQADTCEANAKILERAVDVGDKRSFAPITRLLRRNGCGPTKHDDCYACLREGDLLKRALTAVKMRREPELLRRDGR